MVWVDVADSLLAGARLVGMGAAIVLLVYVCVRAASVAHFRTRLEHLRNVLKEMNKGEDHGKE